MRKISVGILQLNTTVGAIQVNKKKIVDSINSIKCDIAVSSELALPGYPPEDLIYFEDFVDANFQALNEIAKETDTPSLIGFVGETKGSLHLDAEERDKTNSAAYIENEKIQNVYDKEKLPDYGVFDEGRYFHPGNGPLLVSPGKSGVLCGVLICEDMWSDTKPEEAKKAGAEILIVLNASPFTTRKQEQRESLAKKISKTLEMPVIYVNNVGGQDEVLFDGGSFATDNEGNITHRNSFMKESVKVFEIELDKKKKSLSAQKEANLETIYKGLMLSLRDYVHKNNFSTVTLGLSGGIDSALTGTIAADALGGANVWGLTMPGPYSSEGSVKDARELAQNCNMKFNVLSIKESYESALDVLSSEGMPFEGKKFSVAEENIQARLRGLNLMAVSNKHGGLVLACGNKSEMSVGYTTLYGDMCGGFSILKDVPKTLVYKLAKWRNSYQGFELMSPIPKNSITKQPSAELAPGQADSNSLPEYDVLDEILELYVEQDLSMQQIKNETPYDPAEIEKVCRLVDKAEYKRRQAPPGVKITEKAFGRERRLPITNAWSGNGS